ncbi:PRC and DUF2382 domain-containing protein [Streptomyces sp. NBC_01387]|uniref:PRC and DUF2382 domain-containing protein n=1 Tax=unclassified Streptomyces TaxID=2593676 RepID=UPI002256F935|nr:PRC and DUF2382 domain-containing protein [Streptomyces sp. NBC_01500]MCX4553389.1 PRC and DUF2382 domain-containing protein [Streptomyces sp. NBC_01500]WSV52394.1 PRC and DUF2382 domain-containing protein [Streptomyces sp. NBC_01014]
MAADFRSPDELTGLMVYDITGDKIGGVEQVYLDDQSGRPEWATVKTGLFGTKETFIPLEGARREENALHIPHAKELVKGAPRLDAEQHLDLAQEQELYEHYGLTHPGVAGGVAGVSNKRATSPMHGEAADTAGTRGTAKATEGTDTRAAKPAQSAGGMYGGLNSPTSTTTGARGGQSSAAAMSARAGADADMEKAGANEELIRSEEQLRVATEEHVSGRARLRKVVVTENVTTTVPVSHEEVHVVREPIKESDRTAAERARIGEAESEVILHAERPVIRKEAVAVERVRMETEKVTEQKEVSTEVRKEQIQYDDGQGTQEHGDMKGTGH